MAKYRSQREKSAAEAMQREFAEFGQQFAVMAGQFASVEAKALLIAERISVSQTAGREVCPSCGR